MPNVIDANGLTLKTRQQIIDEMKFGGDGFAGLFDIYGADINLDPNSADGNLLNLVAQVAIDFEEFVQQVYDSFDPDEAIGVVLDMRCAYNGIVRKAGTRTTQLVTVTVTAALTLPGLDTFPDAPFTISDAAGNLFQLIATNAFGGAGTANLNFQAVEIGAVVVTANTLTNIVTVTAGVSGVTNGILAGVTGTNEETDAALRVRRQQSVEIPSKGFLEGLVGALLAIDGVTSAIVLENITSVADANGIPGHSIWAIVNGGTNSDVADAIYVKRNAGCGMKGGVTVNINQVDSTIFAVKFDRPTPQNLWISFDIAAITGPAVDAVALRNQLLAQLTYTIDQPADSSAIVALIKSLLPNASVSAEGVSGDNVTYAALLSPTAVNNQWALAAARIIINGTPG